MLATQPLPSFETQEGLQKAFGKALFKQKAIDEKRLAMHQLLCEIYKKQNDGVELKD